MGKKRLTRTGVFFGGGWENFSPRDRGHVRGAQKSSHNRQPRRHGCCGGVGRHGCLVGAHARLCCERLQPGFEHGAPTFEHGAPSRGVTSGESAAVAGKLESRLFPRRGGESGVRFRGGDCGAGISRPPFGPQVPFGSLGKLLLLLVRHGIFRWCAVSLHLHLIARCGHVPWPGASVL